MLVLVPSPLSQTTPQLPVLAADLPLVHSIRTWAVENAKPARAALANLGMQVPIHTLALHEMQTCTAKQRDILIQASSAEAPLGIISDAGCPGIADPGSDWVQRAHQLNIVVRPLVGPCSPTLALMASGLSGQHFTFHGYPPIAQDACAAWLQSTMHKTQTNQASTKAAPLCTHIAIETPFRNIKFFQTLLQTLAPHALLCLAWNLHSQTEQVRTQSVSSWRSTHEQTCLKINKIPCIFLWQHPS